MSKNLMQVVNSTEQDIESLEGFKDRLPSVPTPELIEGYLVVNKVKLRVKKFRDVVRDELADDIKGRLFDTEPDYIDDRGHRYYKGKFGNEIMLERRTKEKFDNDAADRILSEYNVKNQATRTEVKVKDAKKVKEQLADSIFKILSLNNLPDRVRQEVKKLRDLLDEFEEVEEIDEEKIDALVKLDVLSESDKEEMYYEDEKFALKESRR